MKLVTVAEMRAIEKEADERGISYRQMMETAGLGLAEVIQSLNVFEEPPKVMALVGSGNNGGDALVALSALARIGWGVEAYLVRPRPAEDSLASQLAQLGGKVTSLADDPGFDHLGDALASAKILIDGVLGTGIQLPLKDEVARALAFVRNFEPLPQVVAVDCPSGMDCDSGEVAPECIPADITVCMAAVKMGMMKFPAFQYLGAVETVPLGLPEDLPAWNAITKEVITSDDVRKALPERPLNAYKGSFGTALIAAGSINYTGAALLAGKAAYRVGAGLVQMAVPGPLHMALAGHLPEATWLLLPNEMGVIASSAVEVLSKGFERATAFLIGPGFGAEDTTGEFVRKLIEKKAPHRGKAAIGFVSTGREVAPDVKETRLPPMVVDADGLRHLARIPDWHSLLPAPAVLTPHPGEMSALTGVPVAEIQADRQTIASTWACKWGHVVVLKGALTVIASPDGRMAVSPIATPALARAGTGDVLSGIVVGLRAQGLDAYEAACAGVWIHGQAGMAAEEKWGTSACVLAGDLLDVIPDVLAGL